MKKRGQIWVETVIYTLIAFALITLVLIFVKPKIEEIRDNVIIEQSIGVLEDIDSIINNIRGVSGNQRMIELGLSKGVLSIDGENDKIFFEIESKNEYSQPGENVDLKKSGIFSYTEDKGEIYDITLTRDYTGEYNITSQMKDQLKEITKASTPYNLLIANKGEDNEGDIIIDIEVTS